MALPKVVVKTQWPQPVPRGRLLDVIDVLPMNPDEGDDGLKWLNGVTWEPKPCRGLLTTDSDVCDPTGLSVTPGDYYECVAAVTQLAFQMYEIFTATPLQWTLAEMEAEMRAHSNLIQSWAFASELITGAASGGSHSLSSEATAPNGAAFGAAATPIWNALPILEAELAERLRGGQGIIHLPPGMLSQAVTHASVSLVGDQYQTPLGHLVVADAGYLDPLAPTGQAASAVGTDWVYASGPVWYRSASWGVVNTDPNQGTDIEHDKLTQFLSSFGLLVFDPCPVTAILVTYDTA